MTKYGLLLHDVSYRIGTFALERVSLSVPCGSYCCLTGPTGSGKTVLLELIAGIRSPAGGTVFISGADMRSVPPEKRRLGFAYQDSMLFPHLSVRENILFARDIHGMFDPRVLRSRLAIIARTLRIHHLLDRHPRFLSGGERQRVSLARALMPSPSLLLLDEPFSALDAPTRAVVRSFLAEICDRERMTVLHVTHDPEDVRLLSGINYMLNAGRIEIRVATGVG
jgi:ABC-type sugar transport system ATPase subunit